MSWISLKNTVTALGNAYEKPMEIKAAPTTTQPHPPSGGGCSGGVPPGGGISASLLEIQVTRQLCQRRVQKSIGFQDSSV